MTLTTHAVVGAAISSAFRLNPGAALLAGFMSHFLLDHLPHWDYIDSAKINEEDSLTIRDFIKIGFDVLLGFGLALLFFTSNGQDGWESILMGAFGGMLPDALLFAYMKIRREPFKLFRRFHHLMHSSLKIKDARWGLFFQAAILLLVLILGNWSFFIW